MITGQPSITARYVAIRRAAHQLVDHPLVFEDPLALRIIDPEAAEALQRNPRHFDRDGLAVYLRAFLAVRSRIAEDALADAVANGVRQYVVLGAGLDTFAYRNPYAPDLTIYEVDHPATQAWKRERLQAAGIPIPAGLVFVPVDFENQRLSGEMSRAGLDPDRPAQISWLGVVPYIAEEAVWETLRWAAGAARSNGGIVFDYAGPLSDLNLIQRAVLTAKAARVRALGEPWRTFLRPEHVMSRLRDLGFDHVEDLGSREINERYFASRDDGLRVGSVGHVARAVARLRAGGVEPIRDVVG